MKKIYFSLLCLFLLSISVAAQEQWNLERCIREALAKSLTIKQANLMKKGSEIEGKRLRMEHLPNLNANTNLGVSFGRVINPVTNLFETENSFYQSVGVNSGLMLFNGFRLNNSIRQNNFQTKASDDDIRQAENDLALNVALAYLNVLFAYENLEIANSRVGLTRHQLDNLDKMIAAGTKPENDRFDIQAQIAIDEQGIVTAQNNIDINLLVLKQQMLMEADFPLVIERPSLDVSQLEALENQSFETVYSAALSTQPNIQAAELREKANQLGIAIARSQMIPSLSIGGNLGTNWSDLEKAPGNFITKKIAQPGVYINGQQTLFEVENSIPTTYNPISYGTQLDNNLGYGFGLTLSVPIFNNYSAKAAVENAKINVINAAISTDLVKQTLKTNIQNALTSAKASKKSLQAAEASSLAAKVALKNADRLAEIGSLNNFEYLSARNRSDTAELNELIARYDYYFKIKVIEYYMGRGIKLN
ncbi:MAG: TolC family protein [Saprospiraceae bacterium]|uniref:TolC family protein n=1 Tax=Candidatus Opimibacter skivensis TaxID=2982028 RepID=A0A9D7SWX9_9BACT|nr:TolC family protein [Candidatus Opimibacter skivensis]